MSSRSRIGWAGYAVTALAATGAGAAGRRSAAGLLKPLPLLLLGGRLAATPLPHRDRLMISGAVVASAVGDVAMWAEEFADDDVAKDRYLACGAGAFALAQVFYCAALARGGARVRPTRFAPRMAVMSEPALVLARHRPRLLTVLGPYGAALATMSAMAADSGLRRLTAGGLLFQASDVTIVNRRFLVTSPPLRRALEAWVLAGYFAAQALLIDGLTDSRGGSLRPLGPGPSTSSTAG